MDKLLLGIDFGTSTNFVTKYDFTLQDAIPIANMGDFGGDNTFENCIYISREGKVILGDPNMLYADPVNFFQDIKRFIASDDWSVKIPNLDNNTFSAKDIAKMIFEHIKIKIESIENREVSGAVITVPYAYSDKYRKRLTEAVESAGIKIIKLIEEPVAAAISYGIFDKEIADNTTKKVVVFDLGGGTFDITVFELTKDNQLKAKIEVLNTDGVEKLGGKDIDSLLSTKFSDILDVDISNFSSKMLRDEFQSKMNRLSEDTKINISVDGEDEIFEPFVINRKTKVLEKDINEDEFNDWLKSNNIIGKISDALERAIWDIDLEVEDIDKVVLAGGSSMIPIIKETVKSFFGKEPVSKNKLAELVGHGAGLLAGMSYDNSINYEVIRKTSKSIGISKGSNFMKVLPKNSLYGRISNSVAIKIPKGDDSLKINFYEGESKNVSENEKIGYCSINKSDFNNKEAHLSLSKDEKTGRVEYYFYDEDNKKVANGFIEN